MKKVVAVSGGFDPIHIGHIRLIQDAAKLGDYLVVIINNDNWLKSKKGYSFMTEIDRREIILAIKGVKAILITNHKVDDKDPSVCNALKDLKPDIFCNGGDRKKGNIPEYDLCKKLGIKMVFNVGYGGKVRSSSELVNNYEKNK